MLAVQNIPALFVYLQYIVFLCFSQAPLGLQLLVLYTPMNELFKTVPLTLVPWCIMLGFTGASWVLGVIITKLVIKHVPY